MWQGWLIPGYGWNKFTRESCVVSGGNAWAKRILCGMSLIFNFGAFAGGGPEGGAGPPLFAPSVDVSNALFLLTGSFFSFLGRGLKVPSFLAIVSDLDLAYSICYI